MKCNKTMVYAGRRLMPGDRFDARGTNDARVLAAIGNAEVVQVLPTVVLAPASRPVRATVLEPVALEPEPEVSDTVVGETAAPAVEPEPEPEPASAINAEQPAAPAVQVPAARAPVLPPVTKSKPAPAAKKAAQKAGKK